MFLFISTFYLKFSNSILNDNRHLGTLRIFKSSESMMDFQFTQYVDLENFIFASNSVESIPLKNLTSIYKKFSFVVFLFK